ncbi:SigE family RNA polymerase sigma factor [Acidothermaceae bacterium B102]|nr:SigE family RNA polymerase sigma factor [Acidothermaceae bacterium B102]
MQEPDGFREFVASRSRALTRTAWLLTGDWFAAEDLVQTSLAKTWPRWERLVQDGAPELYVRRVMINTYATWWRRRWRHEVATQDLPDAVDRDDVYAQVDLRSVLSAALAGLPNRQRATIVLRFMDDLTEAQTAEVLGCSIGTVKSQTAKALTHLRHYPGLSVASWEAQRHD